MSKEASYVHHTSYGLEEETSERFVRSTLWSHKDILSLQPGRQSGSNLIPDHAFFIRKS